MKRTRQCSVGPVASWRTSLAGRVGRGKVTAEAWFPLARAFARPSQPTEGVPGLEPSLLLKRNSRGSSRNAVSPNLEVGNTSPKQITLVCVDQELVRQRRGGCVHHGRAWESRACVYTPGLHLDVVDRRRSSDGDRDLDPYSPRNTLRGKQVHPHGDARAWIPSLCEEVEDGRQYRSNRDYRQESLNARPARPRQPVEHGVSLTAEAA